jgi:hypothetical protein
MLINEVIERADALLENEYTQEEKYHWCDVVGAELMSSCLKRFARAELKHWEDGLALLPEDCIFDRIEKFIVGKNHEELAKEDMRTYGLRFVVRGYGKHYIGYDGNPPDITVIYRQSYRPIRRESFKNVSVEKSGTSLIVPGKQCPFNVGDVISITINKKQHNLSILEKDAVISDSDRGTAAFRYSLTFSSEDGFTDKDGKYTADIARVVTDTTLCEPPFDEMYIDYICAQIAFYQRKSDVYQQFIARYNTRFTELCKYMREYAAENDYTEFKNWWVL